MANDKHISFDILAYYDEKLKAYEKVITDAIEAKADTLIGTDTAKSVRTIANEELVAKLIPSTAKETLDTLEEIAAWIQSHPDDASAMNTAIGKLEGIVAGIGGDEDTYKTVTAYVAAQVAAAQTDINTELAKKVDKVEGSRLMTNDEGTKLAGIAEGAQVNVIESLKVKKGDAEAEAVTVSDKGVIVDVSDKVDKASGKSLLADTEISRLAAMSDGANKAEVSAEYTSGIKVGTVTIDGTGTDLYVPVATTAEIDALFAPKA